MKNWLHSLRIVCAALAMLFLTTGCASVYIDSTTREIPAQEFKKPANPAPVQMLFEFQTKGALNTRATELLKAQVFEQVKTSGLFSSVSESPVEGGALLGITVNNVPVTDDAFAKGMVTGLTFGLAGSQVTDGYIATLRFQPSAQADTIIVTARHALHTTVGATSAPTNARKAEGFESAVRTMIRELVSVGLNDLSQGRTTVP